MAATDNAALLDGLKKEQAALQAFVSLLEREQSLLMENQTEPLIALSEQKSTSAIALNALSEARQKLMPSEGEQTAAGMADWLSQNQPQVVPLWQSLMTLTDQAWQLNRVNGELIQMRWRNNQQALRVLSNAVNQANLYGPNGQTSYSPNSGRSLGSG